MYSSIASIENKLTHAEGTLPPRGSCYSMHCFYFIVYPYFSFKKFRYNSQCDIMTFYAFVLFK